MDISALSRAGLDRLHDAMAARVANGEMPGLVTLVARDDEVHVDAIGAMAFGDAEPMRRDTIFRIASMTKPVVAAATMQLVEGGALALDEPVDRLLPELAGRRVLRRIDGPVDDTVPATRQISVEDLLTFRLGYGMILEPTFEPPFPIIEAARAFPLTEGAPGRDVPVDPDTWMRRFGSLPLMHQPGERWQYNTGSLALGVLVARAAGEPLESFLRTRIFEPLGMDETGFSLPVEHADRLPTQYATDRGGEIAPRQDCGPDVWTRPPVFASAAGGLLSTADDFLAFARMLLDKGVSGGRRLLSERSVELMTANRLTPDQIAGGGFLLSGSGWGLGMAVTVVPDAVSPAPGRYGWSGGYGTTWFNDPARRLIAIALTQNDGFLWSGAMTEFQELAAGAGGQG